MKKYMYKKGALVFVEKVGLDKELHEIPIANFMIKIMAHIKVFGPDGTTRQKVRVSGKSGGGKLPTIEVDAKDFYKFGWLHDQWGLKVSIFPGVKERQLFKESVEYFGRKAIDETVHSYTGYIETEDGLVYMSNGHVISKNKVQSKVICALPSHLDSYEIPAPKGTGDDSKRYVQASLGLLTISKSNKSIGAIMLATISRAILGHAKRPDYSVFVVGRTGGYKSTLASVAQSHYGSGFGLDNFPGHWGSTSNANEFLVNSINHAVFVCDDFKYKNANLKSKINDEIDSLTRNIANGSSRARLTAIESGVKLSTPESMLLITGETIPVDAAPSMHARIVYVGINPGELDKDVMSQLLDAGRGGTLVQTTSHYIKYYISNRKKITDTFLADIRSNVIKLDRATDIKHDRIKNNFAQILASLRAFLRFAITTSAINAAKAKELYAESEIAIIKLASSQDELTSHMSYQNAISEAFEQAIRDSAIRIGDVLKSERSEPNPSGSDNVVGWRDRDTQITYVDKKLFNPRQIEAYMPKELIHSIPMSSNAFWIFMKKIGMLIEQGSSADRNCVRKTIHGENRKVYPTHLHLRE